MDRRPLGATAAAYRPAAAVRRSHCRAIVLAAVGYTVVVTLLASWRGPGVTPDSVAYASAARELAQTGTLTIFDGGHLRFFPPGLPLTLAGLTMLGIPLGVAVTGLNCLVASGTVVATERIAVRATGSPVLAAACAAVLAVSMGFVTVNAMLWTEPIVGLTTALWILLLQRLHANGALTRADVVALVVTITVSYTYRYAALFMLVVTAVSVALVYSRRGRRRAVATSLLVTGGATIGLAAIAVENLRHEIGPLGRRAASTLDGGDVAGQIVTSLGALPVNSDEAPLPVLGVAGSAVVAGLAALLVRAHRARPWRRPSGAWLVSPMTPLVIATSAYWVFLVASELTTAINPIGYRLLYPILPAMVVLGVVGVRTLVVGSRRSFARWLWQIRYAVFAAYVTVLACAGIGWSFAAADQGISYSQVSLRDEPWVDVVRQLPSDAGLISDNPYLVHWLTGHEPVRPAFGLDFYASGDTEGRADFLCLLVHDRAETYLLWLGDDATKGVRDFANLGFSTTPVEIGVDYALYDVTSCLGAPL
ncbi:MAG: hypothetical protein ACRDP2_01180 [Nocardioidaceae bacterium]